MEIVYKDEFVEIREDKINRVLEAETLKFTPQEISVKLLEKVYEIFKKNGYKKLISITTKMAAIPAELKEYVENVWYPKMISLGVLTSAYLLPSTMVGKMAAMAMNKKSEKLFQENGVINKYFTKIEKAREWLKNQPEEPLLVA